MTRTLYKEIKQANGTLTIRELTNDETALLYFHELTPEQKKQVDDPKDDELIYFIAEETVYKLNDFMHLIHYPENSALAEFHAYADDTNTSILLLKLSEDNEHVRLFIAY